MSYKRRQPMVVADVARIVPRWHPCGGLNEIRSESATIPCRSKFERNIAEIFALEGVGYSSNVQRFVVGTDPEGNDIEYTPDFITDIKINGKTLVVEVHSMKFFDKKSFLEKYRAFHEIYGKDYYFVIFTDMPVEGIELLKRERRIQGHIADELVIENTIVGKLKKEIKKEVEEFELAPSEKKLIASIRQEDPERLEESMGAQRYGVYKIWEATMCTPRAEEAAIKKLFDDETRARLFEHLQGIVHAWKEEQGLTVAQVNRLRFARTALKK